MDSDTSVTGGETPEEKPAEATAGEQEKAEDKPSGPATEQIPMAGKMPPTEPPKAAKIPVQHNWMLIALIAVTCAAIFLLIVTLALGATLAFHHERRDGLKEFGKRGMGPMMRGFGERGWRQGSPWGQQSAPPAQSAPPSGQ